MKDLTLPTKNTWCLGCGNFLLFDAFKKAIINLEKKGEKRENFVLTTGIGCHGKISEYININSFYGLHGRSIPLATGIKVGNPELKVVCCSGDGDSYSEGISHLIHAAKRNSDITVIIHDNHNFALTVKQFTATSPYGFKGSTTPGGSIEEPFNPLELMLASGATFIARGYAGQVNHLSSIIEQGIAHQGFSFIEVLQPCIAWFDTYQKYNERTYQHNTKDFLSKEKALEVIKEWDYKNGDKIPLGIFYKKEKSSFEQELLSGFSGKKKINTHTLIKKHA